MLSISHAQQDGATKWLAHLVSRFEQAGRKYILVIQGHLSPWKQKRLANVYTAALSLIIIFPILSVLIIICFFGCEALIYPLIHGGLIGSSNV